MHLVYPSEEFWRKSSYSAANGDCVQVARLRNGQISVRDSKNIALPALGFAPARWQTFVAEVKQDPAAVRS